MSFSGLAEPVASPDDHLLFRYEIPSLFPQSDCFCYCRTIHMSCYNAFQRSISIVMRFRRLVITVVKCSPLYLGLQVRSSGKMWSGCIWLSHHCYFINSFTPTHRCCNLICRKALLNKLYYNFLWAIFKIHFLCAFLIQLSLI